MTYEELISDPSLSAKDIAVIEKFRSYFEYFDPNEFSYIKGDSAGSRMIIYKERMYFYSFKDGIHIYRYKDNKCYELFKKEKVKHKRLRSRKAKVFIQFRKVLVSAVLGIVVIYGGAFLHKKSQKTPEVPETIATTIEIEEEPTTQEVLEPIIEETKENDITLSFPGSALAAYKYEKRMETHQVFGQSIQYYASRYGLDASFLEALISQERNDDIFKANPGQLTDSICGGSGFTAPIFQDGNLVGQDKIFVLNSYYKDYPLKDLETLGNFSKFTEEEQDEVKKAIQLKKEGYEILKITDLKYQKDEESLNKNIQVSALYLSYLVNQKKDLFQGAVSYNAGPNKIDSDIDYDDLIAGAFDTNGDPFYITHVASYFTTDDYINGFTVLFKDGTSRHYNLEKEKKEEDIYEKDAYPIRR